MLESDISQREMVVQPFTLMLTFVSVQERISLMDRTVKNSSLF